MGTLLALILIAPCLDLDASGVLQVKMTEPCSNQGKITANCMKTKYKYVPRPDERRMKSIVNLK
jgi:hypothetical protein